MRAAHPALIAHQPQARMIVKSSAPKLRLIAQNDIQQGTVDFDAAPAMLSPLLDEIVYRCPACHIERKQTVMRAD
jgi:hypothetical protein